jgi:hypothetical protein
LGTILSIRGVEYNWKNASNNRIDGLKDVGFIAQELLPFVPEVVYQSKDQIYGVRYNEIVALCIEAIKEQEKNISDLEIRAEKVLEKARQNGLLV